MHILWYLDILLNRYMLRWSPYFRDGETVTAHAARAQVYGRRWGCRLCRMLNRLDPGHCTRALGDGQ